MPNVKMKISMVGSNLSYVPGDILEVNEEIAAAWQENQIADLYESEVVKVINHGEEIKEKSPEETEQETEIPNEGEQKQQGSDK